MLSFQVLTEFQLEDLISRIDEPFPPKGWWFTHPDVPHRQRAVEQNLNNPPPSLWCHRVSVPLGSLTGPTGPYDYQKLGVSVIFGLMIVSCFVKSSPFAAPSHRKIYSSIWPSHYNGSIPHEHRIVSGSRFAEFKDWRVVFSANLVSNHPRGRNRPTCVC